MKMSEYLDFSQFRSRVRLVGKLVLETGLRVGAGAKESVIGASISVVKDAWGKPFIPGSSLKGALRAYVEQLARTMALQAPKDKHGRPLVWACENPLDTEKGLCVKAKRKEELVKKAKDERELARLIASESCPVCRLFGSPWLAGKLRVKDLPVDEDTYVGRVEVRDGVGIRRDTRTVARQLLFNFEAVPAGTCFDFEMVIENADEVEMGLAMLGLRELQQGRVFLGGARSRGLGRVKLEINFDPDSGTGRVDAQDTETLLDYLATGKMKPLAQADPDNYIKELIKVLKGKKVPLSEAFKRFLENIKELVKMLRGKKEDEDVSVGA
jgi:CRISPR-associated RAMP protein (TIGR02581 family)